MISLFIIIGLGLLYSRLTLPKYTCDAIQDQINIVDKDFKDKAEYFLIHRVSGFQEKIESLEVHKGKPVFDECMNSEDTIIYADSIDKNFSNSFKVIIDQNDKFIKRQKTKRIDEQKQYFELELMIEDGSKL